MEINEETFLITAEINKGLEPTTFAVAPEKKNETDASHEKVFRLSREKDKDTLAVLSRDNDHWQQIEGDFDKKEIDAIGAAIDAHYA